MIVVGGTTTPRRPSRRRLRSQLTVAGIVILLAASGIWWYYSYAYTRPVLEAPLRAGSYEVEMDQYSPTLIPTPWNVRLFEEGDTGPAYGPRRSVSPSLLTRYAIEGERVSWWRFKQELHLGQVDGLMVQVGDSANVKSVDMSLVSDGRTRRPPLRPGDDVSFDSGLSLTVPEGYEPHLSTGSKGGRLDQTQELVLESLAETSGPGTVFIISSEATTISARSLADFAQVSLSPVSSSTTASVFVSKDKYLSGRRLYVVVTHKPGASTGVVVFGGEDEPVDQAVLKVWSLLKVEGVEPPH